MAKKKKPALKKVAKEMPYWPGLTRLHDKRVGCGAILLLDEQARVLLDAVEIALDSGREDMEGGRFYDRLRSVRRILEFTFEETT